MVELVPLFAESSYAAAEITKIHTYIHILYIYILFLDLTITLCIFDKLWHPEENKYCMLIALLMLLLLLVFHF